MARENILTGQVYGTVDWITKDRREIGMFLRPSSARQTRCVLQGPEVERMLANNQIATGMEVTAFGELYGRCVSQTNGMVPEVVCEACRVTPEHPHERRIPGGIYANMKAVVLFWDAAKLQLKTFFNYKDPGKPEQLTCSVYMRNWVEGMVTDSQQSFLKELRVGRGFTTSAVVEVGQYLSRGKQVPVLQLLPTDFRLQG